ncbi:MAG: diguanylate cyclase [Rhodocyclaceae bacterium]|nr:diguanylate cyclase [Rhodocyclaceae bacterium]
MIARILARLGMRGRLLFAATLPALLMVTVLEIVFLNQYQNNSERVFIERGKAIVQQMSTAAEYALFSGSVDTIERLAASVRESNADIVAVSVLDAAGERVAVAGTQTHEPLALVDTLQIGGDDDLVLIQGAIRQQAVPLDAELWALESAAAFNAQPIFGYVLVELSRAHLKERYREMLHITLSVLLAGFLLASWISARIADDVLARLEAARLDLARQKEIAETLARTDALTGLVNRRAFDAALDQEIRRAQRYDAPLSLVITDIDHFKSINDRFGHHVGDQVLIDFARTLTAAVRDVDTVGRWGGEEFVILMPGTALEEAAIVAERMRLAVAGAPTRTPGVTCGYTASFGVTAYGEASSTADTLMASADAALYRAKNGGRNRVEKG